MVRQLFNLFVLLADSVGELGLSIAKPVINAPLKLLSVSFNIFDALEKLVSIPEHEAQLGV